MMEAAPAASLVVPQAEFLFQLLVIAFDPPAQLGQIDQAIERHVRRDGGKPIFGGLGVALGPFDQQPFLIPRLGPPRVTMRRPHPNPGKARDQRSRASLAPGNRLPACCQLAAGRPSASALTLTGWCSASRRMSFGRRPRPDQGSGGSGTVPGGHTEVCGGIPATWLSPRVPISSR